MDMERENKRPQYGKVYALRGMKRVYISLKGETNFKRAFAGNLYSLQPQNKLSLLRVESFRHFAV